MGFFRGGDGAEGVGVRDARDVALVGEGCGDCAFPLGGVAGGREGREGAVDVGIELACEGVYV